MNDLQLSIMHVVKVWGETEKTPIPLQHVVSNVSSDVSKDTVKGAIRALIKKGYLRKAVRRTSTACYVQLRS